MSTVIKYTSVFFHIITLLSIAVVFFTWTFSERYNIVFVFFMSMPALIFHFIWLLMIRKLTPIRGKGLVGVGFGATGLMLLLYPVILFLSQGGFVWDDHVYPFVFILFLTTCVGACFINLSAASILKFQETE